jgi:hypothetical protein
LEELGVLRRPGGWGGLRRMMGAERSRGGERGDKGSKNG